MDDLYARGLDTYYYYSSLADEKEQVGVNGGNGGVYMVEEPELESVKVCLLAVFVDVEVQRALLNEIYPLGSFVCHALCLASFVDL